MEITAERLIDAGWKYVGCAYYRGKKSIHQHYNDWQMWEAGVMKVVKLMDEL